MDKLLEQIERDVSRIDNLTQGNVMLEPLRQERRWRSNALHWQQIREQAKLLFNAISSRWLCDCECGHKANLKLEVRRVGDQENGSRPRFKLIFSSGDAAFNTVSTPWDWRAVEIISFETSALSTIAGPRKVVSFAPVAPSPAQSQSPNKLAISASKIPSLCNVLRQDQEETCCLGFLEDQTWQHYIYNTHKWKPKQELSNFVSLHDCLGFDVAASLVAKPGGLSVKER